MAKNYKITGHVITKAKVWWNCMVVENEMRDKRPFTVDLCFVEKQKELEKLGITFNTEKTKGKNKGQPHDSESPWITCGSEYPIDKVYHPNRTKFSEEEIKSIGNGTEVVVKINVIEGENKYGPYTTPAVSQMVVTKLEKYEEPDELDEDLFTSVDGGQELDDDVEDIFAEAG